MGIQTPTVNRESALGPAKLAGSTATLPPSELATIHNFLAGGNGDSQLGTLDSQLDSQLLAGEMARMAISKQRSPFPRWIFTLTRALT
jgi:hypothetical protein